MGAGEWHLSQKGASPSAAPVSASASHPAPGPRRPSWGSRTPGGGVDLRALTAGTLAAAWLPALSCYAGLRGPEAGRPHTWPSPEHLAGRGASLQAPNPGFGASGSEGGADGSSFPRSPRNHAPPQPSPARPLASPPRVARGVAVRGLAFREREGAWPFGFALKWLQSAARASGRGRRDRVMVAVRVGPTGPNRTGH